MKILKFRYLIVLVLWIFYRIKIVQYQKNLGTTALVPNCVTPAPRTTEDKVLDTTTKYLQMPGNRVMARTEYRDREQPGEARRLRVVKKE